MDVVNLNSTNFVGLTSKYSLDNSLKFNENIFFTEQDVYVPLSESLREVNDQKINNYSNIILTKKDLLLSAAYIENLDEMPDYGFSTYFAANAPGSITPTTKFWVVQEPDVDINVATVSVNGELSNINNKYFFDVEFLSNKYCKISHENKNITRYLTVDYTGNLSFCKDLGLDSLGEYSPQIFMFIYDRDFRFIVLIKNINDICRYVSFNANNLSLTLAEPLTATAIPYSTSSIFRINPRNKAPNDTKIKDSWLSYKKDFFTNSQLINDLRSFEQINSNLLLNSEYYNVEDNSIDYNILSLKNTNTSENYQARGNPFFDENNIEFRDYQSLFTGSNQEYGDDNISLGYETYTTSILLKKDKVTYFHIPQNFYPFFQLNVNDSYLAESGAIAGDHPLKADKIFKKKGDYKYTSHFGDTREETTGEFLCSWLSGSIDPNVRPVWVDRYYNPKNISFFKALTSSDYKAIKYISVFDCLVNEANAVLGDVDVFDKPSDLIFEKGTYYAYHHYGPKDVQKFILSLSKNLIQKNLTIYKYYNGSDVISYNNEYAFTGNEYAATGSLSAITNNNQFTLIFDAYSLDWTKPMGNQIIGNYNRDGFGIFNQNTITPLLFFNSPSAIFINNTDILNLSKLDVDGIIKGVIRTQSLEDFYLIMDNNTVKRFNLSLSEVRSTSYNQNIGTVRDFTNTDDYAYVFFDNKANPEDPSIMRVAEVDLNSNVIIDYTSSVDFNKRAPSAPDISVCNTIDLYEDEFYFTDGTKSEVLNNDILFKKNNLILQWNNINTTSSLTTAFYSATTIEDFTVDFDKNIWVLFDKNKFAKFTSEREFLLSGYFDDSSYENYKIESLAEFRGSEYIKEIYVSRLSNQIENKTTHYKLSQQGTIVSSTTTQFATAGYSNITNASFLRINNQQKYSPSNFNIKAKLINMYNLNSYQTTEIVYNLSALDPGYHNFAIRFDSYEGYMHLFIDGQLQAYSEFDPRKYRFTNIPQRPFLIGSSTYVNSIPLFNFLKNKSYLVHGLTIKNFYLYNKPIFDFDIMFHARNNMHIRDINFNVACGRRNYVEEIERYFKLRPPGSKSTMFNLIMRNSGIADKELQYALEQRILSILATTAPAYTKLNKIKWAN